MHDRNGMPVMTGRVAKRCECRSFPACDFDAKGGTAREMHYPSVGREKPSITNIPAFSGLRLPYFRDEDRTLRPRGC
jgi:hypothetical protein